MDVPPKGECVWGCGRSDWAVEHIFGTNTLAKRLGITLPIHTQIGDGERDSEIVLVDRVCKRCNNGWMQRWDNLMLDFMGGAITHGPRARVELSKGRQERLARWAIKVALLLEVFLHDMREAHPDFGISPAHASPDHFHKLKGGHPQKGTRVCVGAADSRFALLPVAWMSMAITVPEETASGIALLRNRGYHCWFNLRHVVFLVMGWDEGNEDAVADDVLDGAKRFPGVLQQIWPVAPERVYWPPKGRLAPQEAASLIKTYDEWPHTGNRPVLPPEHR